MLLDPTTNLDDEFRQSGWESSAEMMAGYRVVLYHRENHVFYPTIFRCPALACSFLTSKAPLSDAPEDIIESVLSWLNERDVAIAMIVSSRWKRIGGSDFTWLPLYTRR